MILIDPSYSCGADAVQEIISKQEEVDILMKNDAYTFCEGFQSALQRFERIKDASSVDGWDGEDAKAVTPRSCYNAKQFLLKTPLGIAAPDPGVDVNGQMTLEWRRSDGRLLSLTFDDRDNVHCIVFLGPEKIYINKPASLGYSGKLKDFLEEITKEVMSNVDSCSAG